MYCFVTLTSTKDCALPCFKTITIPTHSKSGLLIDPLLLRIQLADW